MTRKVGEEETGSWQWAASPTSSWHFKPTAEVVWFDERADGFTNAYGVDIVGQRVGLGRLKAGPELSYRHVTADGTVIEPRVAAQALWAFSRAGSGSSGGLDAVSGSGIGAAPLEEFQMRFEAGLKVERSDGVRMEFEHHVFWGWIRVERGVARMLIHQNFTLGSSCAQLFRVTRKPCEPAVNVGNDDA